MTSRNVHLLSNCSPTAIGTEVCCRSRLRLAGFSARSGSSMKNGIVLCDFVTEIEAIRWIEASMHVNEYFKIVAEFVADGFHLLKAVSDRASGFKCPAFRVVYHAPSDELPTGFVGLPTTLDEGINCATAVYAGSRRPCLWCVRLKVHRREHSVLFL